MCRSSNLNMKQYGRCVASGKKPPTAVFKLRSFRIENQRLITTQLKNLFPAQVGLIKSSGRYALNHNTD